MKDQKNFTKISNHLKKMNIKEIKFKKESKILRGKKIVNLQIFLKIFRIKLKKIYLMKKKDNTFKKKINNIHKIILRIRYKIFRDHSLSKDKIKCKIQFKIKVFLNLEIDKIIIK